MLEINEKVIKKQANAVIFDRGNTLYLNNYVKEIKVEYEKNSTLMILAGIVASVENRVDLRTKILLGMKTETIEFTCECDDFKLSNKKKACKHIVATLLRYLKGQPKFVQLQLGLNDKIDTVTVNNDVVAEEKSSVPSQLKNTVSFEMIKREPNTFINNKETIKEKKKPLIPKPVSRLQLKLEPQFIYTYNNEQASALLKLKIGDISTYKIKDIRAFLLALKNKKALEIDPAFKFSPEKHSFKKSDIELLRLITTSNKFAAKKFDGDKVLLEDKEVKQLLTLMKNRSFDYVINDAVYINKKIMQNNLPLEFIITTEKDKVILKQLNELPLPLCSDKDYFFFRGNIYLPNSIQSYRYSSLYDEFLSTGKNSKIYEGEDIDAIIDLLSFKYKEISKLFKVVVKEKSFSTELKLHTNIHLDVIDKGLLIKPIFCYGDVEIDLFSNAKYVNSSKVEKRDVDSERKIINQIKNFHFIHSRSGFLLSYENTDYIINFIKTGLAKLEQMADLNCSEAFNGIKIYEAEDYSPEIHFHTNYLDFSLKIDEVTLRDTANIFEAINDYEDYYRLSNGNYISLANKELIKIADIIGDRTIEDSSRIKGQFTVSRRISIFTNKEISRRPMGRLERLPVRKFAEEELLQKKLRENEKLYEEKKKKLKDILMSLEQAKAEDSTNLVPPELDSIMRNYQKTGFKWFNMLAKQKLGGILADEMGLGKTLQAIALMLSDVEKYKEARKPSLVIAPTSLIYNWENEIQKFAPELKSMVIYGSQKDRAILHEDLNKADVIITTYSLISKDIDEYKNMEFCFCFIDEAQQIKNPKTQAAKAVKAIKADARFALTGTPIENSLSELWSIFDFVMPGYLLSHRNFKEHYEIPIIKYKDPKALDSLNNIVRPFILRRLKKEVLYELPPKLEQKLIVEMTEEQKEAYYEYLGNAKNSINDEINSKGFNRSHIHILSVLTRLRQLCCHPSVVISDYTGDSGKLLVLDNIIEESILNNHRILIFSQFVSVLKILKTRLTENNVNCLYLDGSTKSQERMRLVDAFNSGEGDVFLISLKAGGFGLNLTGADVVIHFDPWWNPAVEEQATDRAHRIGQTKNVEVIKLITKGSIEEKITKLHERKKNIADSIISGKDSEDSFITKLTREEIEDLFNL